jgi:LCP family protein required for cell wall assembly
LTTLIAIVTLTLCACSSIRSEETIQTFQNAEHSALVANYENIATISSLDNTETVLNGFADEDRKELFYTFLIIGLDKGINTDTIVVASYDAINKKADVINIQRDSLVNVAREVRRISAAYPTGTQHGGRAGGIAQLQQEIKSIIGFVPDYYVSIDFNAFVKMVDTVGGVEVEVPFHMKYDDPFQDLYIDIPEGKQHLDGESALFFARYRIGNHGFNTVSDYQRIENQQAIIEAVLTGLLKPANIIKIPEFIEIFTEHVHSNIEKEEMLWFASQLNEIRGSQALSTYTMPTTGTSGPPMFYEYLDEAAIVQLVNGTINPFKKDIEAKNLDIISE